MNISNTNKDNSPKQDYSYDAEYVNMALPDGEAVRFKRVWSDYRFTDREVEMLMLGMEIRIKTAYTDGINGSLDWQEYNGYEYFGFAPWDAEAYSIHDAPFPIQWNSHVFTSEEQAVLRKGEKLLLVCTSNRTGSSYAVNVSYGLITGDTLNRWGIIPHFEEFERPACDFTRESCLFMPMFGGTVFSQREIQNVRQGGSIYFEGISKKGRDYTCRLTLELDKERNRWRLEPDF